MAWNHVLPEYYDDMIISPILFSPPVERSYEPQKIVRTSSGDSDTTCSSVSDDAGLYRKKVKNTKSPDPKNQECFECGFIAATQSGLRVHQKLKHKYTGVYKCDYCTFIGQNTVVLKKHILRRHREEKRYKCSDCDYYTPLEYYLKRHTAEAHQRKQIFTCKKCDFKANASGTLRRHLQTHHTGRTLWCFHCFFKTENQRDLVHHIRIEHENMKEYFCPSCNFKTVHLTSLKVHLYCQHDKDMSIDCPYCQYSAICEDSLNCHIVKKHCIFNPGQSSETLTDEGTCDMKGVRKPLKKATKRHINNVKSKTTSNYPSFKVGVKIGRKKGRLQALPFQKPSKYDTEDGFVTPSDYPVLRSILNTDANISLPSRFNSDLESENENKSCHIWHTEKCIEFNCKKCSCINRCRSNQKLKKPYKCHHCEFITNNAANIIHHMSKQHLNEGIIKCPICPYTTRRPKYMERHMEKHFWVRRCKTEPSKHAVKSRHCKLKHHETVSQNLPGTAEFLQCPKCKYETKFYWELETHFKIHSQTVAFSSQKISPTEKTHQKIKCQQCNYSATTTRQVKHHTKTVHEEQPEYACQMCNFTTVHLHSLKMHIMAIHTGERPYLCDDCPYAAVQSSALRCHIKKKHPNRAYLLLRRQ